MSTIAVNAITDANGGATTTINSVTPNVNNVVGKNKIINGNMVIDQRNAGASVNNTTSILYTLDRFNTYGNQASKFSVQQSTTAPAGFTNSAKITSLSAYTVGASEIFRFTQIIEGFNCSDLAWGTSSAKTVTLSFWVRSSLTGTFGGSLVMGPSGGLAYPYSYTINSADTWEQKSITISGPTTGAWSGTGNSNFVFLHFGLGVGSTYSGTAGAWSAVANYNSVTGATSVVGTSGATLYITGVQLEVGDTATEFEHRPYGTELSLCYRYYEAVGDIVGGTTQQTLFADNYSAGAGQTTAQFNWFYRQEKRATPTIAIYGTLVTSNVSGSVGALNPTSRNCCLYGSPSAAGRVYWFNSAGSGFSANAEL